VHEAGEAREVAVIADCHVMVHGDAPPGEPACGAGDGRMRLVQQHQALGVGGQQLGGAPLQRVGLVSRRMPADRQHQVRLADRLLRPRRQLFVGEEQHVVRADFKRIERTCRLCAVERRAGRQHLASLGAVEEQHFAGPSERTHQALHKRMWQRAVAGADQGKRARPRIGRRRPADVGLGDAAGERHGQRAPDRGGLGRQRLEVGPAQSQHQAVAQGRDGSCAHAAGQKGDLADRLAGAELGDRGAAAVQRDDEAAGHDDIECVRRLALPHQDFAALEAQGLQLGRQPRPLVHGQVVEDRDRVEAVLGGILWHRWLLARRFPCASLAQVCHRKN
jgi:hypothetical protein